jgi:hypothetical protein
MAFRKTAGHRLAGILLVLRLGGGQGGCAQHHSDSNAMDRIMSPHGLR